MTLSALIRKRVTGDIATAISATQSKREAATVARIATVAVANSVGNKTTFNGAGARDEGVSLADLIRGRSPPGNSGKLDEAFEERAAIMEFDGCISREDAEREAVKQSRRAPGRPLNTSERSEIDAYLSAIGEDDPVCIAEVWRLCGIDEESRQGFLRSARNLPYIMKREAK